ncbi:hypothetical protein MMC28_006413 [Mycoblastus sanguinarius]|nr:hypothetical protein [Mycoblastus sanguinarius]
MDTLAVEIIHQICEELENDPKSCKSLRLVCRKFNMVAVEHLFKTLLLFQHPKSWAKLNRVAHCSRLVAFVRKLNVASIGYLPVFASYDEWYQDVIRCVYAFNDQQTPNLPWHYEKYLEWSVEERENPSSPSQTYQYFDDLRLERLPRLTSIEVLDSDHLWGPQREYKPNRRELETLVEDVFCTRVDNRHLDMVCYSAVFSPCFIRTLTLHHYREIIEHENALSMNLKNLGIKELNLDLRPMLSKNDEGLERLRYEKDWKIARWLRNMPELQHFKLHQQWSHGLPVNLFKMLSDVNWPKLQTLHIENLPGSPVDLSQFIAKHGRALHSITIRLPFFVPKEWQCVTSTVEEVRKTYSRTIALRMLETNFAEAFALAHFAQDLPTLSRMRGEEVMFCSSEPAEAPRTSDSVQQIVVTPPSPNVASETAPTAPSRGRGPLPAPPRNARWSRRSRIAVLRRLSL